MGGSKPAKNKVMETDLSREQLSILKDRENFYNTFAMPEMKNYFEQVKNFELSNDYKAANRNLMANQQVGLVRDQFGVNRNQLSLNLAKRGLRGSGVEANSLTQLGSAEASAVGNTVTDTQLKSILERNQIIGMQNQNSLAKQQMYQSALGQLLGMAPQPSQAAPQAMMQDPNKESPWGSVLSGGVTGAQVGGQAGGPWGAVIGAVVGAGAGYASAT